MICAEGARKTGWNGLDVFVTQLRRFSGLLLLLLLPACLQRRPYVIHSETTTKHTNMKYCSFWLVFLCLRQRLQKRYALGLSVRLLATIF